MASSLMNSRRASKTSTLCLNVMGGGAGDWFVKDGTGLETDEGLSRFVLGSGIDVGVEVDVEVDVSGVRKLCSRGSSSTVRVVTASGPSGIPLFISTSSSDSPLNVLVQLSSERDLFLDPSWCWWFCPCPCLLVPLPGAIGRDLVVGLRRRVKRDLNSPASSVELWSTTEETSVWRKLSALTAGFSSHISRNLTRN